MTMTPASPPTTCPDWCDSGTIHAGDNTHSHASDVWNDREADLSVSVVQHINDGSWLVKFNPAPHATIYYGQGAVEDVTASDCRALASALVEAAGKLDEITGAER